MVRLYRIRFLSSRCVPRILKCKNQAKQTTVLNNSYEQFSL